MGVFSESVIIDLDILRKKLKLTKHKLEDLGFRFVGDLRNPLEIIVTKNNKIIKRETREQRKKR